MKLTLRQIKDRARLFAGNVLYGALAEGPEIDGLSDEDAAKVLAEVEVIAQRIHHWRLRNHKFSMGKGGKK